jgi:hypothetical protein
LNVEFVVHPIKGYKGSSFGSYIQSVFSLRPWVSIRYPLLPRLHSDDGRHRLLVLSCKIESAQHVNEIVNANVSRLPTRFFVFVTPKALC